MYFVIFKNKIKNRTICFLNKLVNRKTTINDEAQKTRKKKKLKRGRKFWSFICTMYILTFLANETLLPCMRISCLVLEIGGIAKYSCCLIGNQDSRLN